MEFLAADDEVHPVQMHGNLYVDVMTEGISTAVG